MSQNKKINLGVIIYNNLNHRHASSNIGDYIQTLAVLNIYKKIVEKKNKRKTPYKFETFIKQALENKIKNFNFIFLKRDNISDKKMYEGYTDIITIMHGWWLHKGLDERKVDFDIPKNIIPIFTSLHIASDQLYEKSNIKKLKKFEPIGCRDNTTLKMLKEKGVDAYFSGCITTTIDFFKWKNKTNINFAVDVRKQKNFKEKTHLEQKWKNLHYSKALFEALEVLKQYSECKSVKTSRLHCFLPCLAMKVPVELIPDQSTLREKYSRLDGLENLDKEKSNFEKIKNDLNKKCLNIV